MPLVKIDTARITLKSWDHSQKLGSGYTGVEAVRIRWLQYTTATAGNTEMSIDIAELKNACTRYLAGAENSKTFISIPLDLQASVTNTYANFSEILDKEYDIPFHVNELNFRVLINGSIASGITPSNPLEIAIDFFQRK